LFTQAKNLKSCRKFIIYHAIASSFEQRVEISQVLF